MLDDGHEYATYELAGGERLNACDMTAAMSQALGRQVSIRSVPSALVAGVAAARLGPRAVPAVKAMLDHYDAHGLVGNANVLRTLLRREPMPFADVMQRELNGTAAGT